MARFSTLGHRARASNRLFSRSAVVSLTFFVGLTFALYNPDDRPLRPTAPSAQNRTAGVLEGSVTNVRDGNTIEVAGTPVRIDNLDCAEMDTDAGRAAQERLLDLVRGKRVTCELVGRMSHVRAVGTCALASSGEDLGETLTAEGVCERWS